MKIELQEGKKIYFASDQHFGAPTPAESKPREERFVEWLDECWGDGRAVNCIRL